MKKNRHRIDFNAARGQRMVVAKFAQSLGGGNVSEATPAPDNAVQSLGDLDICKPNPLRNLVLHPVTLSVALALVMGFVFVTTARAHIVATPSDPGNQRSTGLQPASELPQVNSQLASGYDGASAMHQHGPHRRDSAFGDPQLPDLPAGAGLSGRQTQPGGKLPA